MTFRFEVTGLTEEERQRLLNVLAAEPIHVVSDAGPVELDVPPERFDYVVAAVKGCPRATYDYMPSPRDVSSPSAIL